MQNEFTGERIAWKPCMPADQEEHKSADLNPDNALPTGWHGVMSHSRPGEIVYARPRLQYVVVA